MTDTGLARATGLDAITLSLSEIQAALGKDFLTDEMLATLMARKLEPAPVLKRARGVFAQALRARTLSSMLGKWVLYEHGAGFWIWLKLGDSVSDAILRGPYDEPVTALIRSFFTPGGTFVDVGANVGWFTLLAGRHYAAVGGQVLAFEPQRELYEHVARSVRNNGFETIVRVENIALGDREAAVQMQNAGLNSGGSFVVPDARRRDTFEDARMARFDKIVGTIGRVDAIKLDIEGSEPMFFEGAADFFRRARPPIVSEINVRKLRNVSNVAADTYVRSVLALGYEVATIAPTGDLLPFDWADLGDDRRSFNVLFSAT